MELQNLTQTLTVEADTRGVSEATSQLQKFDAAQTAVSRSALSLESSAAKIERRWDALARVEAQAARDASVLDRAVVQGTVSAERAARIHEQMAAKVEAVRLRQQAASSAISAHSSIANDNSRVVALNAGAWQNLGFQINDVATSLASGSSPFQVLAQQGGQVYQVLSMANGGVGGALREIGERLLGILTPARIAGGVVTAIAATGVAAWASWRSEQDELARSMSGVGRAAGATLDTVTRLSAIGAARGGISTSNGMGIAGQLAATGEIGAEQFAGIIATSRRYAKITGQDLEAAGADLAKALADPSKGADELNKRLGFLDDRTRQLIITFKAQGDAAGAQRTLFDAYAAAVDKAADRTSLLAKAWERVKAGTSNAFSGLGQSIDRTFAPSASQQLEDGLSRSQRRAFTFDPERRQELMGQQTLRLWEAAMNEVAASLRAGADKRASDRSIEAGGIVRGALPEVEAARELSERIENLRRALSDPEVSGRIAGNSGLALSRLATLQANQDPTLRLRQDSDLAVQGALARTNAERTLVEMERARLQVLRETGDVLRAAMAAEAERSRAVAAASAELRLAGRSATDQAALVGLNELQRGLKQIQFETRDLRERTSVPAEALRPVPAPASTAGPSANAIADPIAELARRMASGGNEVPAASQSFGPSRNGFAGALQTTNTFEERLAEQRARDAAANPPAPPRSGIASPVDAEQIQSIREATLARSMFVDVVKQQEDALRAQNSSLDAQAATFGKTTAEVAAYTKQQELLVGFQTRGLTLTDEQLAQIERLAAGYGMAAARAEQLQRAQKKATEAMDFARGAFDDVVGGWARGLARGEKGIDAFRAGVEKLNERLLNMALNQLSNSLFGAPGTNGANGGLFSGLIGGMLGGGGGMNPFAAGAGGYSGEGPFMPAGGSLLTTILGSLIKGMIGFADGGIMTSGGPLPLHTYAKGGVANSPQMALFGEGRGPEAFVPLPDGRSIPVSMKGGQQQRSSAPVVNMVVENHSGAQVSQTSQRGPDGSHMIRMMIRNEVLGDMAGNGPIAKTMQGQYGLSRMAGRKL